MNQLAEFKDTGSRIKSGMTVKRESNVFWFLPQMALCSESRMRSQPSTMVTGMLLLNLLT